MVEATQKRSGRWIDEMKNSTASKAGCVEQEYHEDVEAAKGRRAIFVDCPPAHAGTVAALRSAFSEPVRGDSVDREFEALLSKLH